MTFRNQKMEALHLTFIRRNARAFACVCKSLRRRSWDFEFRGNRIRHCLHGRSFICNCIGCDAVTPLVYTVPVRFRYKNRVVLKTLSNVERFKNDTFHWSCKRRNRIDSKTVWREIGLLAKCRFRFGFQVMKPFRLETASV